MLSQSPYAISLIEETIDEYQNELYTLVRADPAQSALRISELKDLIFDLELSIKALRNIPALPKETIFERIKARFLATSAGNWKVYHTDEGTHIGTDFDNPQLKSPLPIVTMSTYAHKPYKRIYIKEADADFIAHSKEDMRWLIEQLELAHKETNE